MDLTTEIVLLLNNSKNNESFVTSSSQRHLYVTIIIVLMYTMIILVAVGGNIAVCCIIVSHRGMRTVTNIFLLTLALSDIIKSLICNPFTFVADFILKYWPFGVFMCPTVTYIQTVAVYLSSFTLVAMSCDRFVAILFPLRPKLTRKQLFVVISVILFCSCALSLPTAVTSKIIFPKPVDPSDPSVNGLCLEIWGSDNQKYIYTLVIMITQYFLPFVAIAMTNVCMGYVVWIKTMPGEAEIARDKRIMTSKKRMVKMIIVVVVIYAVCWLPLHAITLAGDSNPNIYDMPHMNVVWVCAHWFAMSHSCYNPFVYFWMNPKFRNGFKKVLRFFHFTKSEKKAAFSFRIDKFEKDMTPGSSVRSKNYQSCPRNGNPLITPELSVAPRESF